MANRQQVLHAKAEAKKPNRAKIVMHYLVSKILDAKRNRLPMIRRNDFILIKRFHLLPYTPRPSHGLMAAIANPPDARKMGAKVKPHYLPGESLWHDESVFSDTTAAAIYEAARVRWDKSCEEAYKFKQRTGYFGVLTAQCVQFWMQRLVTGLAEYYTNRKRTLNLIGCWELLHLEYIKRVDKAVEAALARSNARGENASSPLHADQHSSFAIRNIFIEWTEKKLADNVRVGWWRYSLGPQIEVVQGRHALDKSAMGHYVGYTGQDVLGKVFKHVAEPDVLDIACHKVGTPDAEWFHIVCHKGQKPGFAPFKPGRGWNQVRDEMGRRSIADYIRRYKNKRADVLIGM